MDALDYNAMDFWWKTSITLINMAIGVYLWWERHNDTTNKRIDQLSDSTSRRMTHLEGSVDKRLDIHTRQLSRIDEHLKHVPTNDDLTEIHQRIDALLAEFKEVKGEFHAANHMLKVIHQHMLSGGKQ